MSSSGPVPRIFGPFVLTRHLGTDPLGGLYRAGTATGARLAPFLLIRVFEGAGISQPSLVPVMEEASEYLEVVRGPAVAKGAVLGIVDDVPFAGIEYVPGRTLDRLFSGEGQGAIPLPVEHALLIAEKLLVALEAGKPFEKKMGAPHGFLTPGFVTISNDGDVRVYGAGLGSGLLPSLKSAPIRSAFAPYIAPEVLASGKPTVAGDIYSAAAILFHALTGKPPAPGAGADSLAGAVLAIDGSPMPDDLGKLVARGLAKDPAQREQDVVAYRKTLGKLLYGGPYAPSTFNLAFFMHQKFEKAIERERIELGQEETIDPKPLVAAEEKKDKDARLKAQAARAAASIPVPSFGGGTSPGTTTLGGTPVAKKGGLGGIPVPVVAGGAVVVLGLAGWLLLGRGPKQPAAPPPTPVPVATPTPMPAPTPVIVGKEDPEFQAALQAKLQEEMKKVQDQISKEQAAATKRRADEQAALEAAAAKAREAEEAVRAARERSDTAEAERLAKEAQEARAREESARKAAEAAVPKVKAGDLLEIGQVTKQPRAVKVVKPEATSLARQKKVSGTVLVRVLVDEKGRPAEVEIYRDTNPKVGLGEASLAAVKKWEFTPAEKDGVPVKTWVVVPLPFVVR
ncbi:MAG TPA: TonB family protein [Thermoanaerobaculia bacterium]|nr:TonB family protein [Thermoanaerobaculia bacterium]